MAHGDKRPIVLGRISGLYGVRGWVKIHSYTDPYDAILDYRRWLIEQGGEWLAATVAEGRQHGKSVVVRFDGVHDRDEAAAYVNARVGVPRESMPATEEGQYYWADLTGLKVVNSDGTVLGTVAYLLETGANDVLVVQGDREILIPYLQGDVVKDVDLGSGLIEVDWKWG